MDNNNRNDGLIKDDKDVLANIAKNDTDTYNETVSEDDDILINELFNAKKATNPTANPPRNIGTMKPKTNAGKTSITSKVPASAIKNHPPMRKDARYSMTVAEIETLAAAAEDAVANGRFGAALDSVFFTAGKAREDLRQKLNIRIPIGSGETDLPVIATAALIESYLGLEAINGEDIEEKLRLIIESSEDENKVRPSADQVELRVFECVLIMCVQAEQCGNHEAIKRRLYGDADSFLRTFLENNIDRVMQKHRRELHAFYNSVKVQSGSVTPIFEEYILNSKSAMPFPVRFFAETKPVLITAIVAAVLCLASIIIYFVTYGNIMSFIATDNFLMTLIIVLELLFCGGLAGISYLVYTGGEEKAEKVQKSNN
ncbi:MAG: hypothetical protein IJ386_01710 [Clostridia bacterium]|nr:hypothetical protein [Clostridia bacterium]